MGQGRAEGSLCLPLPPLRGRFKGFSLPPARTSPLLKANPTGSWRSPHTPGALLWLLLPRCCRGLTSNESQLTGFCWDLRTRGPALLLLKPKEVSAVGLENQNQTLQRNAATPCELNSTPVVFTASWAESIELHCSGPRCTSPVGNLPERSFQASASFSGKAFAGERCWGALQGLAARRGSATGLAEHREGGQGDSLSALASGRAFIMLLETQ